MISTLTLFIIAGFFVFGLVIGSFLNVVICRWNTKKSLGGRSACMSCRNQLCWYELIPLISFITLRGRCRSCQTRISVLYPSVEILTGLTFVALFLKFQDIFSISLPVFTVTYMYYATMFSFLIVIAAYDLRHKIIPDILSFVFGVLGFTGLFFFNTDNFIWFYPHIPSVLDFLSGPLIALPFALFWLASYGAWMGLGAAKLVLGLGWLLGISASFSAIIFAFWAGAIIGLCLIFFKRGYSMKSEIPFALYLVLGTFLVFLFDLNLFAYA